jgi:hypothetical protein
MIINKNIHPERDVYYLGAKVIEVLSTQESNLFDYFEVFAQLNEKEKISINLFSLVLDWLFIIGVIKNGNKGLEKCF